MKETFNIKVFELILHTYLKDKDLEIIENIGFIVNIDNKLIPMFYN